MKTIIIFLFLYSIVFAQYNTYDLIIEYEQECFNDSSLQHTHIIKWYDRSCVTQKGNQEDGYYNELACEDSSHYTYVHKEPDFAGFREFVKRKYQKLVEPIND